MEMVETRTVSLVFLIFSVVAMGMGKIFLHTSLVVSLVILLVGAIVSQVFGWVNVLEEAKMSLALLLVVQLWFLLGAMSLPLGASLVWSTWC